MIKSMTGFGRGEYADADRQISIEIKSVNSRFLDLTIKLPRQLNIFEDRIRKTVSGAISRGKVDVFVTFIELSRPGSRVNVDMGLAGGYAGALRKMSEELGIPCDLKASDFLRIPDVVTVTGEDMDEDLVWSQIKKALDAALTNLIAMRETEGAALKANLSGMLDNINTMMETIKQKAPTVALDYKEKLTDRLDSLLDGDKPIDPQRLAQEVAIFADKCSVDEEITRMFSHIAQFRNILEQDEAIGRKLDFLVQEMNREANTTGSKANDLTLTRSVLDIKAELEKIREQIQNIE